MSQFTQEDQDPQPRSGAVHSVERSFQLLDELAKAGGQASLSDLTETSGLAPATAHRLIRTLVEIGLVRQTPDRHYALGSRLIQLGDTAARMFATWAEPHLAKLVDAVGETANLAELDGHEVVYLAQAPSPHSMRMFTEVGRRVEPHCTGVGKAMLAARDDHEVEEIIKLTGMARKTESTLTTLPELFQALDEIRQVGYAVDEGEQEVGVRCIAMALPGMPHRFAVSISGPAARVTADRDATIVPKLRQAAEALSQELAHHQL